MKNLPADLGSRHRPRSAPSWPGDGGLRPWGKHDQAPVGRPVGRLPGRPQQIGHEAAVVQQRVEGAAHQQGRGDSGGNQILGQASGGAEPSVHHLERGGVETPLPRAEPVDAGAHGRPSTRRPGGASRRCGREAPASAPPRRARPRRRRCGPPGPPVPSADDRAPRRRHRAAPARGAPARAGSGSRGRAPERRGPARRRGRAGSRDPPATNPPP